MGPHVGAILGAFLYQILIGFHWPEVVEISSDIQIQEMNNKFSGKINLSHQTRVVSLKHLTDL